MVILFLVASATHFLLKLCAPKLGREVYLPGPLKRQVVVA
jgi:hypothetical protein